MSEEFPAAIAAAIIKVAAQVRQIGVDENNPHGGYKYVSVDRFYSIIGPMMAEAGLALLIDEVETDVKEGSSGKPWLFARYALRFMHESGAIAPPLMRSIAMPISGPQAFGAAQSYIEKQFIRQVMKIPTGDKDADETAQNETPPPRRPTSRPAAPVENGRDDAQVSANLLIQTLSGARDLAHLDDLIDEHDGTIQQFGFSRRDLYADIITCLKETRRKLREKAAAEPVQTHDAPNPLAGDGMTRAQQTPSADGLAIASYAIAPKRINGKVDWEGWVKEFTASISAAGLTNLHYVLGDNEQHIEGYKRAMGPAVAGALDALIKHQWERIG
jgi:ERF superfamily